MDLGEMIGSLPESRRAWAWDAAERGKVRVLWRIALTEGPASVEAIFQAIAETEGQEAAVNLRAAYEATGEEQRKAS